MIQAHHWTPHVEPERKPNTNPSLTLASSRAYHSPPTLNPLHTLMPILFHTFMLSGASAGVTVCTADADVHSRMVRLTG